VVAMTVKENMESAGGYAAAKCGCYDAAITPIRPQGGD
jgi:hypothetical protein